MKGGSFYIKSQKYRERRMIIMKANEYDYYNELANWSFEDINCTSENFTSWVYEEEIRKHVSKTSKVLDLGTAAGEKVLKNFP